MSCIPGCVDRYADGVSSTRLCAYSTQPSHKAIPTESSEGLLYVIAASYLLEIK